MSDYPIEISKKCWEELDSYLEEVYQKHPFKRIRKNGVFLGYEGFMDNYSLTVDDMGSKITVSLVVSNNVVAYQAIFDKQSGLEEVVYERD